MHAGGFYKIKSALTIVTIGWVLCMYQAFVERFLYVISFNLTAIIGVECCCEPT